MAVHFHEDDLPAGRRSFADGPIAVDTEAMGLVPGRDRLCLVQLSDGAGTSISSASAAEATMRRRTQGAPRPIPTG